MPGIPSDRIDEYEPIHFSRVFERVIPCDVASEGAADKTEAPYVQAGSERIRKLDIALPAVNAFIGRRTGYAEARDIHPSDKRDEQQSGNEKPLDEKMRVRSPPIRYQH